MAQPLKLLINNRSILKLYFSCFWKQEQKSWDIHTGIFSPFLAISCHFSPFLTISHHFSPFLAISRHFSPSIITFCHLSQILEFLEKIVLDLFSSRFMRTPKVSRSRLEIWEVLKKLSVLLSKMGTWKWKCSEIIIK